VLFAPAAPVDAEAAPADPNKARTANIAANPAKNLKRGPAMAETLFLRKVLRSQRHKERGNKQRNNNITHIR
jgi:hypothetical protein